MSGSMDGLKLAHAIRERWPPIELILTSGHFDLSDDGIPERGRKRSFRPYSILSLRSDNGIGGEVQREH